MSAVVKSPESPPPVKAKAKADEIAKAIGIPDHSIEYRGGQTKLVVACKFNYIVIVISDEGKVLNVYGT